MLDFIHLSETGVAEIAKSTNLKGCPHTFLCEYGILYMPVKLNRRNSVVPLDEAREPLFLLLNVYPEMSFE